MLPIWAASSNKTPENTMAIINTDIKDEKSRENLRFSSRFETGVISIDNNPAKLISLKNSLPKYNTIDTKIAKSNILLSRASPGCGNIDEIILYDTVSAFYMDQN